MSVSSENEVAAASEPVPLFTDVNVQPEHE